MMYFEYFMKIEREGKGRGRELVKLVSKYLNC